MVVDVVVGDDVVWVIHYVACVVCQFYSHKVIQSVKIHA